MYLQVFIEPLRKVASTLAVDGLLGYCRVTEERLLLQSLGMMIGIKAWCDDFKVMTLENETPCYQHTKKPPSVPIPRPEPVHVSASLP